MKRNRNSFFNESSFQQSFGSAMPNYGVQPNMPMNGFGSQASQSFYTGPMQSTMSNMPSNDYMSDMESRLAKIERNINRLDARISKLESKGVITTETIDNSNNMYML